MVGPESMKIDNIWMVNVGQHFKHILQLVLLETIQLKLLFLVQGTEKKLLVCSLSIYSHNLITKHFGYLNGPELSGF